MKLDNCYLVSKAAHSSSSWLLFDAESEFLSVGGCFCKCIELGEVYSPWVEEVHMHMKKSKLTHIFYHLAHKLEDSGHEAHVQAGLREPGSQSPRVEEPVLGDA